MAGQGGEPRESPFDVEVLYSRSRYWVASSGEVRGGGCHMAQLVGLYANPGVGKTVEDALEDLASALRCWLEHYDQYEPPADYPEEPTAVQRVREAVRSGTLIDELRQGAREPVLDPVDEPRRRDAAGGRCS